MSLINLFVAARTAIVGRRQRQRAFVELMALDDRSLSDIGIRRSQIPSVIEGFHESPSIALAPALIRSQAHLAGDHRWLPRA